MDNFLARNEKLVRENENLKITLQNLISENKHLTSNLQKVTNHFLEDATVPGGSGSFTKTTNQPQSTISEEQFKLGLQPHRASSPVNLKMLFESSNYVENEDTGFASQDKDNGLANVDKEQCERLLGEIAYQLDRRILSNIFQSNKRFYGYSVTNIPSKIIEVSTHPLTGKVDEDYRLHLNQRYENITEMLSRSGYKISLHPQFSEFIVNTFGILQMRPEEGSSQATNFYNPMFLRTVIETTAPLKLQKDLVLLLNCLCDLAEKDEKPVFLW